MINLLVAAMIVWQGQVGSEHTMDEETCRVILMDSGMVVVEERDIDSLGKDGWSLKRENSHVVESLSSTIKSLVKL